MTLYRPHHIHLHTRDAQIAAEYYERMFGARVVTSTRLDDRRARRDVEFDGLKIYFTEVSDQEAVGIDHFGLLVDDLDAAAVELRGRGASFELEPTKSRIRAGLKLAFIKTPEDIRIELLQVE